MKFLVSIFLSSGILYSQTLTYQAFAVAPPGTTEQYIRLIAIPMPAKILKKTTGLSSKDAMAWNLSAKNLCKDATQITFDDFSFTFPELQLINASDAQMLLTRNSSLSFYTLGTHAVQDIPMILAVTVQPWIALAAPILSKVEQRLTEISPQTAQLTAQFKPQITLLSGMTDSMKSLSGPMKNPINYDKKIDCKSKEELR